MKNFNARHLASLAAFILVASMNFTCSKSNVNPVVTLKFAAPTSSYNESQGIVNADIALSSKASQDIVLTYSWAGGDTTAFLGGDFSFVSANPLTIKAGETSAKISIQIIDDTQIDTDDVIKLTLVSATGATVSGTASEIIHALTITSNDVPSTNKLQVDLTWNIKTTSKSPVDINGVNLDIFAQYDVVITNSQITSGGTNNSKSVNTTGFETLYINTIDPDKVYYLAVNYTAGTSKVDFAVALNGWGYANGSSLVNVGLSDFIPSEVNSAIFFGPFNKVNNTFTRGRTTQTKILQFRARDFIPPNH